MLRLGWRSSTDFSTRPVPARPITELAQRLGEFLWDKLRALLEESLSLAAAIDDLSEIYLEGKDVLFEDTRSELDARISDLRQTAELFRPLAAWLKMEPIMSEGFTADDPVVDARTSKLVNFAR